MKLTSNVAKFLRCFGALLRDRIVSHHKRAIWQVQMQRQYNENMKLSNVLFAVSLFLAIESRAQTASGTASEPSDKEVARLLKTGPQGWIPNFEKNTEVPALTFQNLPSTQRVFRIGALKAVSKNIQNAARASTMTYSDDDLSGSSWQRITVPRQKTLFKDAVSIVFINVDHNGKSIQIAVRGTSNLDDVLYDLKAASTFDDELGFRLHSGFRTLAREIWAHLKKYNLSEDMLRAYTFHLSGHSLGGSIASIISMYLHQEGSQVASVVTFGAPRFTTNEGARKYQVLNQVTHRIVRCDDVVPFMPPPNFFGWSNESYQANGNIFLLLKPPYFDYSVGIDIERDFAYQLRLEVENKGVTKMLAFGHRMDHYATQLGKFDPLGLMMKPIKSPAGDLIGVPDLQPVTYTLALQSQLCPAQVDTEL